MDFDALENTPVENENVNIELVTLSGREKLEVREGMTVRDFKEQNGLVGKNIINEASEVLRDSDTIDRDMQIFVSTPKKNG